MRPDAVVQRAPIHAQILPYLRRNIIDHRWQPGERLREATLCREFGVSRTPLRQALKVLETEGLVRLVPHAGAIVTDPDGAAVAEKMEVLIGLEQLAATRVAERRPPEVLRHIEDIYRQMVAAARGADAGRYFRLNDDFHRTIVRGTANASLIALHEQMMSHVERERRRANEGEPFSLEAARHHEPIVASIRAGEASAAGEAMRRHLDDVVSLMLARRSSPSG